MNHRLSSLIFFLFLFMAAVPLDAQGASKVSVGVDEFIKGDYGHLLKGKRVGLLTNHTAVNSKMESTIDLLYTHQQPKGYRLVALFAPEHGLYGAAYASESVEDSKGPHGLTIYSLHGKNRRPTKQMLQQVDTIVYDMQDIGTRSYTYITTLFYLMEEAAKLGVAVIVLDRPNPINGVVVDGPMMEDKWRSMVGYINVPYCHGMTIGELASFFNQEYKVGCKLEVVPMRGWKRTMSFKDTGLPWIPTSPNIPEPSTPFFYPMTGILGELQIVNIGIGYTLPFKLVGAPWIDAKGFAKKLNEQQFPGVHFEPFFFRPFYGRFAHEDCQGILIVVTDPLKYKPVSTQYLIIGMLKSLYPAEFMKAVESAKGRKEMFCKVNGTEEVYKLVAESKNIVWKLRGLHEGEREAFMGVRKKYLIPEY